MYQDYELIQTISIRGTNKTYLITPNVAIMSQQAFGCNSLIGMELEDQGGNGIAGNHWEERIMFNDYLTADVWENALYSTITLAMFIDTGWYNVNYTTAQVPIFGRNDGCNFFQETIFWRKISDLLTSWEKVSERSKVL